VSCETSTICVAVGAFVTGGTSVELIAESAPLLRITHVAAQTAHVGSTYSLQLVTSGGVGPTTYRVTSGTLPAGIVLDAITGLLVGTPTMAGSASFVVAASNGGPPSQTAEVSVTMTVAAKALTSTTSVVLAATGTNFAALLEGGLVVTFLGVAAVTVGRSRRKTR
jgi:hypothetical protein